MNVRDLLLGLAVSGAIFSASNTVLAQTCESQFSSIASAESIKQTIIIGEVEINFGQFKSFLSGTDLKALHRETIVDWENGVFSVDMGRAPGKYLMGINQLVYDRNLVRINYLNGKSEYYLVRGYENINIGDTYGTKLHVENRFGEKTEFVVQFVRNSSSSFFSGKTGQGVDIEAPLKVSRNKSIESFSEDFAIDMTKAETKYMGMNVNESMVLPGGPVWVNTVKWLEVPVAVQNSLPEMDITYTTWAVEVSYTDGSTSVYHVDDIEGDEGQYALLLTDNSGERVGDVRMSFESGELFEGIAYLSGTFPKGTGVSVSMTPVKDDVKPIPVGLPQIGPTIPRPVGLPQPGTTRPFPVGLPQIGPTIPRPVGLPQPGTTEPLPVGLPQFEPLINGIVAPNPNVVGLPMPNNFVEFGETTVLMTTFTSDQRYFNFSAQPTVYPAPPRINSAEIGRAQTADYKAVEVIILNFNNGVVEYYLVNDHKMVNSKMVNYSVVDIHGAKRVFTSRDARRGGPGMFLNGQSTSGLSFKLKRVFGGGQPVGLPQPGTDDGDIAGIRIPIGLPQPPQN